MARIYSWSDIKSHLSCEEYLRQQGITLNKDNRCAATWRGGKNEYSVHVEGEKWFDFAVGKGGSVLDLAAQIEFNGDIVRAAQELGDRLNLKPSITTKKIVKTRSQQLIADGYVETAVYDYQDENGNLIYSVVRYEKEGEKKQFIHRTPEHEGLDKDTPKLLYNLPAIIKSQEIWIVEGEKDVETLRSFGIVATTNSGGATSWVQENNKYFIDKDVVIIADNDTPGKERGDNLSAVLQHIAKSVHLVVISSLPHGDITDWFEKEGGTIQRLREIVAETKETIFESPEIASARMANSISFSNYTIIETVVGGRAKQEQVPRSLEEMLEDVRTRFLGFPRVLGEVMFDWTRGSKDIMYILSKNDLFAWIQRISHHNIQWGKGIGMVSGEELFCALHQSARKYVGLSKAPHFPTRKDVFYVHDALPPPDPSHSSFWKFVDFFNPSDENHRLLLAAMIIAPLYFEEAAERPMWIVDTQDAQSSGKTTLVKLISYLYCDSPFVLDIKDVDNNLSQVMRRMISSAGRMKRIALFDNMTGTLRSQNLATLITLDALTGLAPYGRTEESRPNDITYMVTVNGAQVDTDIATRSYTVRLSAPKETKASWEFDVRSYINSNRLQIFSDIIHMIQHNNLDCSRKKSRFGMFDKTILSAVCKTKEQFEKIDEVLCGESAQANEDEDRANEFLELFLEKIAESATVSTQYPIFIRSADVDTMLEYHTGALKKYKSNAIRLFIKQGLLKGFNRDVMRFPPSPKYDMPMYRGFLFGEYKKSEKNFVQLIHRNQYGTFVLDKTLEIIPRMKGQTDED